MTARPALGIPAPAVPLGLAGLVALALPLLSAPPAAAVYRDDGDDPGQGLSALETVGYFVGGPALLFLVITALVYATNRNGQERYRPGQGWYAAPVWFQGPPADERPKEMDDLPTYETTTGGGASARW